MYDIQELDEMLEQAYADGDMGKVEYLSQILEEIIEAGY